MTDELKSRAQRLEAMLALAREGESPFGAKPSFEEIAAWHAGRLSEVRAREVKAHVARDPECYRFWYELRLEQQDSERVILTGQRRGVSTQGRDPGLWAGLKRLLPPSTAAISVTGLAGAMAVVFVLMVALPLIRSPDLYERIDRQYAAWEHDTLPDVDVWPWRKAGVEKGLGSLEDLLRKPDLERNAFRVGVRTGLQTLAADAEQWQKTIDSLPDTLRPCSEAEAEARCVERQQLQRAAGQWSALVYLSCKGGSARTQSFWAEQYELLEELKARLASVGEPGELTRYLSRWKPQRSDGTAMFCESAQKLLVLGLSG